LLGLWLWVWGAACGFPTEVYNPSAPIRTCG